jgi:acetylornithine deacetylase
MSPPTVKTVDMIKRLVAFDTVSRNPNLALIEFIQGYLAELGVDSELTFDDSRTKANLFATLGPADRPGIVLSGHTDVVPVDGQDWQTDPFAVTESDGKLFGRGTADMKSFIAVALALAPEILSSGLKAPIHFAFSYDEEVGCVGVPRLLAALARLPVTPAACIVGEPTEMAVVTGHKGKKSVRCRVRGQACHSALATQGVNAVEIAAELVIRLRRMGRRFRDEGPHDPAFEPSYTTVQAGVITGGTAVNIVPSECVFEFEFRNLPAHDADAMVQELKAYAERELLAEMHAVSPRAGFDWEEMSAFPGLETADDAKVTEFAKACSGANATAKVSFGTEAGLYHEAGIPAVVCGPGSIAQAHRANEFIALGQVAACEAFLRRLIDRLHPRRQGVLDVDLLHHEGNDDLAGVALHALHQRLRRPFGREHGDELGDLRQPLPALLVGLPVRRLGFAGDKMGNLERRAVEVRAQGLGEPAERPARGRVGRGAGPGEPRGRGVDVHDVPAARFSMAGRKACVTLKAAK